MAAFPGASQTGRLPPVKIHHWSKFCSNVATICCRIKWINIEKLTLQWWSTRCASRVFLGPRAIPSTALGVLISSKVQNLSSPVLTIRCLKNREIWVGCCFQFFTSLTARVELSPCSKLADEALRTSHLVLQENPSLPQTCRSGRRWTWRQSTRCLKKKKRRRFQNKTPTLPQCFTGKW